MKRGKPFWSPPLPHSVINWSIPAAHIAKAFDVSCTTVTAFMRRHGIPVAHQGVPAGSTWQASTSRGGQPVIKHSITPDWSKRDTALGREHGCCREYMRQLRVAAGEPASGSMAWFTKYHEGKNTNRLHLNQIAA